MSSTEPLDTVLDALRLEQALHVHGYPEHARFMELKRQLRDAFYVETPKWKSQVYEQTLGYCEGAMRCLERESFSAD